MMKCDLVDLNKIKLASYREVLQKVISFKI